MTPTLVLTRPEAQSREIVAELGRDVPAIISPVMRFVAAGSVPDIRSYAGVVFTSANALAFAPDMHGTPAWCVGIRTAEAAQAAGAQVHLIARDADDLVARFVGAGPILHLRGEHARGRIAERLTSAGIETEEAVVYRQVALALSPEALLALEGDAPVVLALYSPRSARLVGQQLSRVGAGVTAIAMSAAVAEAWRAATGRGARVVPEPTGEAMLAAIRNALDRDTA